MTDLLIWMIFLNSGMILSLYRVVYFLLCCEGILYKKTTISEIFTF